MAFGLGESGSVTAKALVVGTIVLLLLVTLGMLRGLVSERSQLREAAYSKVAEGWGGSIVAGGPMLIVPCERTITTKDGTEITRRNIYLLPSRLDADVDLQMQEEPR